MSSTPLSAIANFPVCLAPMVGLSHAPLRKSVRKYLPRGAKTLWPTEMLSSWRLPHEEMGKTWETLQLAGENTLVPQILGNEQEPIHKSIAKLEAWGAVGVDINMGCPVAKALRHNYGVALMGDPDYASSVVKMAKSASKLPVSVKLRAGIQKDMVYLHKFLRGLQDAGADWITLHPRLAQQKRRGFADWSMLPEVQKNLDIPVIGNGDIQTAEAAIQHLNDFKVPMVMIGRGLSARPWLLWQVGRKLGWPDPEGMENDTLPECAESEGAEYGKNLLDTIRIYRNLTLPEAEGLKKIRFSVRMNHMWLQFGNNLWSEVSASKSYSEMEERVARFFSRPQSMQKTTALCE